MRYQAPRGTQDVLPSQSPRWLHLEQTFRRLVAQWGYQEIRTPTFEDTDLFVRSSGETSDIVTKQMYTFVDKGGRSITLKPEGTAPVVRAMLEHSLFTPGSVLRLSYVTPIFRYERPQKGRLREAHQVGLELVGSPSAAADAEVIEVTVRFYQAMGLQDVRVLLNSIGREACRSRFREAILEHSKRYLADQSEETRARIEKNPLRLLDSKDPAAQDAIAGLPSIQQYLEDESRQRLDTVRRLLTDADVPFVDAPHIVRGLDYYTETVFEVQSQHLGAQSALCGGGRYDDLVRDLGGPPTPSVGVGMGIERLLIVLEQLEASPPSRHLDAYVVAATPDTVDECRALARDLRKAGCRVQTDLDSKAMKAQLKAADRAGARFAVILGPEELEKGVVQVRDLASSEQVEVPRVGLTSVLRADS